MHQLVAEWVDDPWKNIASDDLVMKRFRQYGYIEYAEFSVLHSELEKTIKQHQFPKDIVPEVNKFLEEIMEIYYRF